MSVVAAKSTAVTASHLIERLDDGNPYFLVIFGEPGSAGAVVAVDASNGEVTSSAQVEQIPSFWVLDKAGAVERAGGQKLLAARLVWAPSRATRSPFYPVWELTFDSYRVFVDRDGNLWSDLLPAGPG